MQSMNKHVPIQQKVIWEGRHEGMWEQRSMERGKQDVRGGIWGLGVQGKISGLGGEGEEGWMVMGEWRFHM